MSAQSMIVAGIMSGTSADGIDVAFVRIDRSRGATTPRLTLLAHRGFPYPAPLRRAVLAAMNAASTSTAELARLHWRLGLAYADAVKALLKQHPVALDLIGCHGQTLYHQATPSTYAGQRFACTWQAGESQVIAAALRVPVVANFRPADILAGPESVIAFDTGPGNMVMDALALELFNQRFDRNGSIAAHGQLLAPVLAAFLRNPYFALKPPRTSGREEFGREYAAKFLTACRRHSAKPEDALATATALTAETIASSYKKFVHRKLRIPAQPNAPIDYIVSGGGARNATLMAMLAQRLPSNCELAATNDFGLPVEAKEAAAFALMAWHTWHHLPGNVPAATGAKHPVILGQVTYAS
jgi:anhydro-N-acetylmuramic acid kinase